MSWRDWLLRRVFPRHAERLERTRWRLETVGWLALVAILLTCVVVLVLHARSLPAPEPRKITPQGPTMWGRLRRGARTAAGSLSTINI